MLLIAANATFALNAPEYCLRFLLISLPLYYARAELSKLSSFGALLHNSNPRIAFFPNQEISSLTSLTNISCPTLVTASFTLADGYAVSTLDFGG